MMRCLWLCLGLLLVSSVLVDAELERAAKTTSDKANKDRQSHKKGTHSKPKLHYTTTAAHEETKYGVDLPSFAFDYSEYFSGAVIERSHDKDLYLSVFLVGHKAVSTDFPFHAISTDEEVMHSWSKAVKLWDKNGHKRTSSNARRLASSTTEPSPRAHNTHSTHSTHSTHYTQSSSGLVCVLQNNDVTPSQVYQATAYWVQAEHDADSASNKNIFAILRCKLRNTAFVYEPGSNFTSKSLFVDIMRMNTLKKIHTKHSTRNATSTTSTTTGSDKVASDSRGSVLSSFSLLWSTRIVGYPMQHHLSASTLDPWSYPTTTSTITNTISTTSASSSTATIPTTISTTSTSTLLCVPNIRPLHPLHPTSLSMLTEYIAHSIQLGFSHVMLGVALDWKSKYMLQYLHVLSTYIKSGHVSIYSTALPGYDDVSGFGGVQLNDVFAEQYFVNMCLYYAKGMYGYVSVGNVDEFVVPGDEYLYSGNASGGSVSSVSSVSRVGSTSGTFVHSIVSKLVSSAGASSKIPTTTRGSSKVHANSVIQYAPCTYALTTQSSTTATLTTPTQPKVSLRGSSSVTTITTRTAIAGGGVSSANSGLVTGRLDIYSAEAIDGKDHYAGATPWPLFDHNNTYGVLFLPTDRVVRVDVSPSRVITGQCRSVQSQQRRGKHASSVSSVYNGTTSGASGVGARTAIMYTTTADVDTPGVALFVYRSAQLPNTNNATTGATAATVLNKYIQARTRLHNTTSTTLSKRYTTSIQALQDESLALFTAAHKSAQAAKPFNPFSDAPIPDKNQLSGEIPTRAAIKAPFWQLCNTDYLKDVIKKVFHI